METFMDALILFPVPPQLPPSEPEPRQVSGAAAVGRAGRLPGAGNGRSLPPLHPEPFPPEHHLRGESLAAAGPA